MRLIIRMNMFTATQVAYITQEDGEVLKTYTLNTNSLDRDVLRICEEDKISNIVISGPMMYTKGFEKKIKQAELVKYNTNNLVISLIK